MPAVRAAPCRAVVFDLDGTLVDSLDDIASALVGALGDHDLATPTPEAIRAWIGDGARALVARAVGDASPGADAALIDRVHARFGERYRADPVARTRIYAGLDQVLDGLVAAGRRLAILSNKPHDLTVTVAERVLARWRFDAVAGQRPGGALKPDPATLDPIAAALDGSLDEAALVGDSPVDVATARARGLIAIAVTWGLRPRDEFVAAGPDHLVDTPRQLAELLALTES